MGQSIFDVSNDKTFEKKALEAFIFQSRHNPVYKSYLERLHINCDEVKKVEDIPFLPIELFKTHQVTVRNKDIQKVFKSSGTSNTGLSSHHISDLSIYEESFKKSFELFFGQITNYCILALLPSYHEQKNSSLIYMVDKLIEKTQNHNSGYYLENVDELETKLVELDKKNEKTILIGVTYALLDFAEKRKLNLKNTIVVETGGMKGRRKEMVREEVHANLCKAFGVNSIYSEYGMTELLSQAYSKGNGLFYSPPWMKVLIRDTEDHACFLEHEKTGGINVIDLANFNSCSFIATQDLGKTHSDGSFEILGRFDNSEIRGCNLMIN